MPVPDTSVLVPLFDEDHPHHRKARKAVAEPVLLYVSGGVLAELTTVLRRRATDIGLDGGTVARESLARLEGLQGFRHVADHDPEAVSRIYHAHRALSYVDAWGIALALQLRDELLTFDERQSAALRREKAAR